MKLIKKFLITAVAAMPVFLCSCPGDSCVDEHDPKGYVVKMKNDYTDKVMVYMFINAVENDTTYCCASVRKHTVNIISDYYDLHSHPSEAVAYTSIDSKDWNIEMMDSIAKYVIDTNPFEEVYAYYKKSYSLDELKKIIENNELNKFERLK
jgi:hypothetical protein